MITNILIALLSLAALQPGEGAKPIDNDNLGQKVAQIQGDKIIFVADTTMLKDHFESVIEMPEVELKKIEILKRHTFGDKKEDYHMLIAYDQNLKLKVAHWLVENEGGLYFFENKTDAEIPNEYFFGTYFVCYASDESCFPLVKYYDDTYSWGTIEEQVCPVDSKCKGRKVYVLPDEY